jgi:osmotically-inducible protein OsmY
MFRSTLSLSTGFLRCFQSHRMSQGILLAALLALCLTLAGCAHLMANMTGPGITDEDPGRRTVGMVVEDNSLQTKILGNLYKIDTRFEDSGIDVVSFNGVVLMAGNVNDESMIRTADKVARTMRNVRKVHNELKVGPSPTTSMRANDAWIASKVRFSMSVTRDFPASRIHVTVNDGAVYLMGLVSEREAADSIMVIGNITGIKRIVKAFEYIADKPRKATPPTPLAPIPARPHRSTPSPAGVTDQGASEPPAGFPAGSEAVQPDDNFRTIPIE